MQESCFHYIFFSWASVCPKSPTTELFVQRPVQSNWKKNKKKKQIQKRLKFCITGFLWGDSPHKGPIMRKAFPYHDVIVQQPSPCLGNRNITEHCESNCEQQNVGKSANCVVYVRCKHVWRHFIWISWNRWHMFTLNKLRYGKQWGYMQ